MGDWTPYLNYVIVEVTLEEFFIYNKEDTLIGFGASLEEAKQKCDKLNKLST